MLMIHVFDQIFHRRMPSEAVDLVSRFLQYSPNLRCTAVSINLGQIFSHHLGQIFSHHLGQILLTDNVLFLLSPVGGVNPPILQ
jgi:hypothetical protein